MSDRTLDADLLARSASSVFSYLVFVELAFDSGTVRTHNGQGTYTFNGNDWYGVGAYGSIDAIDEKIDAAPQPIRLTLSTITPELITAIRTDNVYGRSAKLYVGALNEELELLGTPTLWIDGFMEKKALVLGEINGLSITIQDEAARINQRNNKRYTLEEHQKRYAEDQFLEYLPYVQDVSITWAGERVRIGFVNEGSITGGEDITSIPSILRRVFRK